MLSALVHPRSILRIGIDPNIKILCVAGFSVFDQRIATDDEIFNLLFVEGSQQISEVLIHSSLPLLSRALQLPYPTPRQILSRQFAPANTPGRETEERPQVVHTKP